MPSRSRPPTTTTARLVIGLALGAAAVVVAWFWLRQAEPPLSANGPPAQTTPSSGPGGSADAGSSAPVPTDERLARSAAWVDLTGGPPLWPADLDEIPDCNEAGADLKELALRASSVGALQDLAGEGGLLHSLQSWSERLSARVPPVTGELDDLEVLRRTATHLYRLFGKKNLLRWSRDLDGARLYLEPLALAVYRYLAAGSACESAGFPPPPGDVQATYAAFLLNTLGGQAYLRRRHPEVEVLASFYALDAADRAERRGHNPYGLDLLPHIRRTEALIRHLPLLLREDYLQRLDTMRQRWENKRKTETIPPSEP